MASSQQQPQEEDPSTLSKDRITCHVLDTILGQPARGMRVRLELNSDTGSGMNSNSNGSVFTPAADQGHNGMIATTGATTAGAGSKHHQPPRTFESQTDDDGRVRVWLPYSSATSSGEVPVYTLDDVLGALDESAAGEAPTDSTSDSSTTTSTWTLRFDVEGYYGADKTFFPEAAVTFRVRGKERYHVPLLLSPNSYTTYRGS